jgi:hypothetical protein
MQFYKEISTKVPVDKINNFIKLHGFQPLDASKVTANQVATSLKYIVELHGLEAYQELENLLASEGGQKSIAEPESKKSTSCDCGCAECEMKNGKAASSSRSANSSVAKTESKVEGILKDKQSLLIIAATAIVLALILKK